MIDCLSKHGNHIHDMISLRVGDVGHKSCNYTCQSPAQRTEALVYNIFSQ